VELVTRYYFLSECRSRSYFTTDGQSASQSVSQYVLVTSTLAGLATRYYFLSECRSRSYFTTDGQSVSQSVCLGNEHPCGTCDQILLSVGMSESKLLYDRWSVSQYVLASSTLVGLATRYYFQSESKLLYDGWSVSQSVCLGIEYP
jgi:hypothetical protein